MVAVEALSCGFRVSSSQITLPHASTALLSISPDVKLDSRVQIILSVVPAGIATVSPTTHFFEPGPTFAVAAKSFQISWSAHGTAVIELHAKGGTRYHAYVASSPVAITALPPLPLVPADLACTPLLEAQLAISFAPPATGSLGGVAAPTGYRVQISTSINFANIAAETRVAAPSTATAAGVAARVRVIMGPLVQGECYHYRVASTNSAGNSGDAVSGVCVVALDSPGPVSSLRVVALTEQKALVQWSPPLDSGDGTPFGVPILSYVVEIMTNGSDVTAERLQVQAAHTSLIVPVRPTDIYTISIFAVSLVALSQSAKANKQAQRTVSAYFSYDGLPVDYIVPLQFTVSALYLSEKVGRTSSFTITPRSAPYVDAVVRIKSNQPSSALATTPLVVFRKVANILRHTCFTKTHGLHARAYHVTAF
jgi:hypothetical protein